jgi:hypothetical protein
MDILAWHNPFLKCVETLAIRDYFLLYSLEFVLCENTEVPEGSLIIAGGIIIHKTES